ncbi:ABC transporter permease [Bacteroidota bacterium]
MNLELFIAKKVFFIKEEKKKAALSIINIAIGGISIGLIVMILAISILSGFKKEIRKKISGFGSHIQILNHDSNFSLETKAIDKNQSFYPAIDTVKGIKHIQIFAIKPGIIKTDDDFLGIMLKGIGSDFDWTFFNNYIIEGSNFIVEDANRTNKVVISKYISNLLLLKPGDKFIMQFPQDPPRIRRFEISGIYDTGLSEFDKVFALCDISHIQRLNNWSENQVGGFEVFIDDFDNLDEMKDITFQIAGSKFFDDGTKLKVIDLKEKNPEIFDLLKLYDTNVWVILTLMLIVAAFNMVSGLLIIILERTNMIGMLKALGAKNYSIRKIFLILSGFLISKGLLWGNIIGLALCFIQNKFQLFKLDPAHYDLSYIPIDLNIINILLLNMGTLLITLFMLILPSYIISGISPDKTIKFN